MVSKNESLEEQNYHTWVLKESVKEDFESDLKKRKLSSFFSILSSLFMFLVIVSIILMFLFKNSLNNEFFAKFVFIFIILSFICFLIVNYFNQRLILSKKNFSSYLLNNLSKMALERINRSSEKAKANKLVKMFRKLFNKREIQEFRDSFEYTNFVNVKKGLRNFSIFLNNKLEQNEFDNLSGILYDISKKIWEGQLNGDFLEPILKAHKGNIEEKPSFFWKFVKSKLKYFITFILLLGVILYSIFSDVSNDVFFNTIGGAIFGGLIGYFLSNK